MKAAETKPAATSAISKEPFFHKENRQNFFNDNSTQPSFFSKRANGSSIQPKLTIGQPNDIYEQEADAMADQVAHRLSDPDPVQTKLAAPAIAPLLQAKCSACEAEEKNELQRKEINEGKTGADASLETYVGGLSKSGQSLPDDVRNFYEPHFGYDFSNVKVHTGSTAANSAQSLNALAYTVGNNIVFGAGQYSPQTHNGKKLLAHELTHVIHQNNVPNNINRYSNIKNIIQCYRVTLPGPFPLCGRSLTHIDIEPPRWRPLEPCLPASVPVFRFNIVGREVSPSSTGMGRQIFNLHIGYYTDPATGRYCAIADDSKRCLIGRCVRIGCFPTLQEVIDAILNFLKRLLQFIGILLLIIIAVLIGRWLSRPGSPAPLPGSSPLIATNEDQQDQPADSGNETQTLEVDQGEGNNTAATA